jgi:DNA-binding GntR family transcriptional regulator
MSDRYQADSDAIEELAAQVLPVFEMWRGRSVALSRDALCRRFSCKDRDLRKALRQLRLEGHLIVPLRSGGYRFAENREEVEEFVGGLTSRIKKMSKLKKAMLDAARHEFPADQRPLL